MCIIFQKKKKVVCGELQCGCDGFSMILFLVASLASLRDG